MNSLIFKFLRYSGLVSYFKNIHQKNTVTILLYHDPNPAVIEKQFKYLLKEYNIISLNDFMLSHKNQDSKTLPSKSLIITFDDGHKRNFEL